MSRSAIAVAERGTIIHIKAPNANLKEWKYRWLHTSAPYTHVLSKPWPSSWQLASAKGIGYGDVVVGYDEDEHKHEDNPS
jgi:hypothetical protein